MYVAHIKRHEDQKGECLREWWSRLGSFEITEMRVWKGEGSVERGGETDWINQWEDEMGTGAGKKQGMHGNNEGQGGNN